MKKLQRDDSRFTAHALGELSGKDDKIVAGLVEDDPALSAEMGKTQALGRLLCEAYEREGLALHPVQRAIIQRVGQSREADTLKSACRKSDFRRGAGIALAAAAAVALVLVILSRTPVSSRSLVEAEPSELHMEVVLSPASLVSWGESARKNPSPEMPTTANGDDAAAGEEENSPGREKSAGQENRREFARRVLNDPQRFFASAELTARRQMLPEASSFVALHENGYLSSSEQPTTIVPVMAGRTSFAWVERFLRERGELPPRDAVRLEELVNYPDYREDAQARVGGVALTSELVPCPWNDDALLLGLLLQREVGATANEEVAVELQIDDERVTQYRLLGFAQPGGDIIPPGGADAAHPLAAGDSTYVFYEIRPDQGAFDPAPLGKVALKVSSRGRPVHRNLDIPAIPGRWIESSQSFRTAATVAAYALVLRDSPYKGSLDFARVESLARQALFDQPQADPATREVLRLIIETRELAGVFPNA